MEETVDMTLVKGCCHDGDAAKRFDKRHLKPLEMAAKHGQTEAARLLLKCGASLLDPREEYPLKLCDFRKAELVKLLVAAFKQTSRRNDFTKWRKVMKKAMRSATDESLDILWENMDTAVYEWLWPQQRLFLAISVEKDGYNALKWFQSKGVDLKKEQAMNLALALYGIRRHVSLAMVEWLLDQGMPLRHGEVDDASLFIAVTGAVWFDAKVDTQVVDMLLQRGSNINARDMSGATPLHAACHERCHMYALHLIKRGADVDMADYQGITPLMVAASVNDVTAVRFLLKAGARTHAVDANGRSALHWACWQNHPRLPINATSWTTVTLLLPNFSGSAHHVDKLGMTPLHIAALYDCKGQVVNMLHTHGFDMDAADHTGLTPRQLCQMLQLSHEWLVRDRETPEDNFPEVQREPELVTILKEQHMTNYEWNWRRDADYGVFEDE